MKNIVINPHNCSREEYQELIEYLSENSWDFTADKIEEEEESEGILHSLGEDSVDGIKINQEIFDEQEFEYSIVDRSEFLDTLIGWIGEATQCKELMKQDLFMLQEWDDDYIFSSISTNEYIRQGDSNFDELCEELLTLNESKETV
jgi:hypothetical protein